jgi:hypothetical protein
MIVVSQRQAGPQIPASPPGFIGKPGNYPLICNQKYAICEVQAIIQVNVQGA